ncbi:hypothetical protein PInf_008327 [Phytophthora infestans]|nr:hypothetical protein PInf_008327 [Phytophthora infestans]
MSPSGFTDRLFNEPGTLITVDLVDLLETQIRFRLLLVKQDKVNGQAIKVSLDRGADHNAIRQGFATEVARRKKAVAERFDVMEEGQAAGHTECNADDMRRVAERDYD